MKRTNFETVKVFQIFYLLLMLPLVKLYKLEDLRVKYKDLKELNILRKRWYYVQELSFSKVNTVFKERAN